eukprot:915249-Rhodomonas_salina.2
MPGDALALEAVLPVVSAQDEGNLWEEDCYTVGEAEGPECKARRGICFDVGGTGHELAPGHTPGAGSSVALCPGQGQPVGGGH